MGEGELGWMLWFQAQLPFLLASYGSNDSSMPRMQKHYIWIETKGDQYCVLVYGEPDMGMGTLGEFNSHVWRPASSMSVCGLL